MAQLLARRTIDRELDSSNPASDSDKCHWVVEGRGPLLANFTSSTEMRHSPALSLPMLTLVGMGEISIIFQVKIVKINDCCSMSSKYQADVQEQSVILTTAR